MVSERSRVNRSHFTGSMQLNHRWTWSGKATSEWGRMVFELTDPAEKDSIRRQLLDYCKLDTLAMVEIYFKIKELI